MLQWPSVWVRHVSGTSGIDSRTLVVFTRRPGSGRPRVTDVRDDRYINLLTRRNPFYSAPRVLREVRQARGINVGVHTIRNRLHDSGLRARLFKCGSSFSTATQASPIAVGSWASWLDHSTNGPEFSSQTNPDSPWIITMDVLGCGDVVEKRFHPQFAVAHNRWGAGSVMIWAGISSEYRTDLHVVQGNVNGQYYLDNMVTRIVVPLATRQNPNFLFMDDNAPAHRARLVPKCPEPEQCRENGVASAVSGSKSYWKLMEYTWRKDPQSW